MTEIEVKDMGYHTCLTVWTGSKRGTMTGTVIYLTPHTRQQLIKALQNPTPYQPHQQDEQETTH